MSDLVLLEECLILRNCRFLRIDNTRGKPMLVIAGGFWLDQKEAMAVLPYIEQFAKTGTFSCISPMKATDTTVEASNATPAPHS
jgi:hypothetical protein